jgi:hypothetical protein
MTAAFMTAAVTGESMTATVAAVTGETTVTGKSPIDRAAIHITAIDVSTGIAGIAKSGAEAGSVEPSAVKISGIGPFKEGPIVGVVIVVPIVAIPGRVAIVCIAREFIIEISADYHAGGRGIFILVNGCRGRFCVDLGLATGSDQTGGYYCGECKERFHDNRAFKLGDIVLLYKKAAEVITYMPMC